MILLGHQLYPELRTKSFAWLMEDSRYVRYAFTPAEERDRFYIVTSFTCNSRCQYCLFRFDARRIRDCDNETFASKVRKILAAYPQNLSISIMGGEPLLDKERIITILDAIRTSGHHAVRWIGFGTNGSTPIPYYLGDYPDFHFDLYISRHHYDHARNIEIFQNKKIKPLSDYCDMPPNVTVRLSCNLIRGDIDCPDQMRRYLDWAKSGIVASITFRELNRVDDRSIDRNTMYNQKHILDYIDYYYQNVVPLADILSGLEHDSDFQFVGQDIRPFIYHEHWQWNGLELLFRHIDEAQLLDYNASYEGIDEIVLHPDGLVTGCWDREQKRLDF